MEETADRKDPLMTNRDRLTQLLAGDFPLNDERRTLHEIVADAILADGWRRIPDADLEAAHHAYMKGYIDVRQVTPLARMKLAFAAAFRNTERLHC